MSNSTDLHTAKQNCESEGYHLVFIEKREEQEFLDETLYGTGELRDGEYWIGIEKQYGEKVWMDGSSINFSRIADGNDGENCYRMKIGYSNQYWWYDRDCSTQFRSICENTGVFFNQVDSRLKLVKGFY